MEKSDNKLSLDFIAGLIVGEGCFTWSNRKKYLFSPSFQLRMHLRDKDLLKKVRDSLGLFCEIYTYHHKDGRKTASLYIRDAQSIENIIIPAFEGRLCGYKKKQFEEWKNKYYKYKQKCIKNTNYISLKEALEKMGLPYYQE